MTQLKRIRLREPLPKLFGRCSAELLASDELSLCLYGDAAVLAFTTTEAHVLSLASLVDAELLVASDAPALVQAQSPPPTSAPRTQLPSVPETRKATKGQK